ncbi:hypothetical protein CERZMDRAFT_16581, partial [Cercospora zeae-maydis SCOH1-5]
GPKAPVYSTDFRPARHAVELEQVRFTGSPKFDDNGDPFLVYPPDQILYTGPPSGQIDLEWEELIKKRYFLIDDDEAREAWGPNYQQYYRYPDQGDKKGGYVAGVDVLHTLHCVNVIRLALQKTYYTAHEGDGATRFEQYHINHCLDIVRQSVQCSSDLTLIPTRWWESLGNYGRQFIDSDQVHTCRSFSKIREWV